MGSGFHRCVYGAFVAEAATVAGRTGRPGKPVIACVVYDEGDGRTQFARWDNALQTVGFCEPVPVLISDDAPMDISALGNADGLLVCGGLTPGTPGAGPGHGRHPGLADARRPALRGILRGIGHRGRDALVGGWMSDGVPICPEDASEDLEELFIRPGLGVVPFLVDVHCAQWGTLPRLITAVHARPDRIGVGIDENTVLIVGPTTTQVRGRGQVWRVENLNGAEVVTSHRAGASIALA